MNPSSAVGWMILSSALAAWPVAARGQEIAPSLRGFPPDARAGQLEYEAALNAVVDRASLRATHERFCREPHVAGTPGDVRMIRALEEMYASLGLDVQVHEIWPLLAEPVRAEIRLAEIRAPGDHPVWSDPLPLQEDPLPEDPHSSHPDLTIGWNAYAASGTVTAPVVYANHGRKEDFQKLRELGVEVRGAIVIARYGGNFRGYKARFAEDAGAVGLIIYTDPDDSGYRKGAPYPEGGWANDSSIQRGSIKTLPYPGDPLTPFEEATRDAPRRSIDEVALPRIPVQPVGWRAAEVILTRMQGPVLPRELRADWQGGLPCAYRLTGGDGLLVRLTVEQQRRLAPTANVLATLRGSTWPDEKIIIGCHFDAWSFGAGDPNSGSIVLHEIARSFADLAQRGRRPGRTIVFANWAAEEFGIIGSTEWVEANREDLAAHAVAYINLDMAAMGPHFGASSTPSLTQVILDATRHVVPARPDHAEATVFQAWSGPAGTEPKLGNLGGGSDHVGFSCHLGVPACGLGAGGSDGVSYHTNYETLTWYRRVVGEDYEPARMLAQVGNVVVARLASAPVLPLDPVRYATDVRAHLEAIATRAEALGRPVDLQALRSDAAALEQAAQTAIEATWAAVERGGMPGGQAETLSQELMTLERQWLHDGGLPERPWYRSLYAASDPDSGYAAWMLPALRWAVERGEPGSIDHWIGQYREALARLQGRLEALGEAARMPHPATSP